MKNWVKGADRGLTNRTEFISFVRWSLYKQLRKCRAQITSRRKRGLPGLVSPCSSADRHRSHRVLKKARISCESETRELSALSMSGRFDIFEDLAGYSWKHGDY